MTALTTLEETVDLKRGTSGSARHAAAVDVTCVFKPVHSLRLGRFGRLPGAIAHVDPAAESRLAVIQNCFVNGFGRAVAQLDSHRDEHVGPALGVLAEQRSLNPSRAILGEVLKQDSAMSRSLPSDIDTAIVVAACDLVRAAAGRVDYLQPAGPRRSDSALVHVHCVLSASGQCSTGGDKPLHVVPRKELEMSGAVEAVASQAGCSVSVSRHWLQRIDCLASPAKLAVCIPPAVRKQLEKQSLSLRRAG